MSVVGETCATSFVLRISRDCARDLRDALVPPQRKDPGGPALAIDEDEHAMLCLAQRFGRPVLVR